MSLSIEKRTTSLLPFPLSCYHSVTLFPLLLISVLDQTCSCYLISLPHSLHPSRMCCQLFIIIFLINLSQFIIFLCGHVVSQPSPGVPTIQLTSQNPSAYLGAQPPHASKEVCVCVLFLCLLCSSIFTCFQTSSSYCVSLCYFVTKITSRLCPCTVCVGLSYDFECKLTTLKVTSV